jgi:hypothetical protein
MDDVVVLLPGITGSALQDSAGRDACAPTAGALVTLGRNLTDLVLRDDNADDGVISPLMVPDLHLIPGLWKIDGYPKLSAYAQPHFAVTPGRNFIAFPYDWRRGNGVAARRLKEAALNGHTPPAKPRARLTTPSGTTPATPPGSPTPSTPTRQPQ